MAHSGWLVAGVDGRRLARSLSRTRVMTSLSQRESWIPAALQAEWIPNGTTKLLFSEMGPTR